jgi:hypothetical protein
MYSLRWTCISEKLGSLVFLCFSTAFFERNFRAKKNPFVMMPRHLFSKTQTALNSKQDLIAFTIHNGHYHSNSFDTTVTRTLSLQNSAPLLSFLSIMNSATANNNEPARETIVDKLHGALSAFRRERDDLHRKKQLAEERLRLMREEQGAMEASVNAMTIKLHKLQESGNEEALQELKAMEEQVLKLQKEVRFLEFASCSLIRGAWLIVLLLHYMYAYLSFNIFFVTA